MILSTSKIPSCKSKKLYSIGKGGRKESSLSFPVVPPVKDERSCKQYNNSRVEQESGQFKRAAIAGWSRMGGTVLRSDDGVSFRLTFSMERPLLDMCAPTHPSYELMGKTYVVSRIVFTVRPVAHSTWVGQSATKTTSGTPAVSSCYLGRECIDLVQMVNTISVPVFQ